jgi:hypothetical protein
MKREKDAYCRQESVRRAGELSNVAAAEAIFQNVLNKLSLRVKLRTQSNTEGKAYSARDKYETAVRNAAGGVESGYRQRVSSRNAIAY